MKSKKFNKRIVECFFTENEQNYIFADNISENKRFAEIWTRKETYFKWIGKDIAMLFDSFDVLHKRKYQFYCMGSIVLYFIKITVVSLFQ